MKNLNVIRECFRGDTVTSVSDELFNKKRLIYFTGEVDISSTEALISQLLHLEARDPGKLITIIINSPGGDVSSGLACIDIIRSITSPVRTVCAGMAASMAALLFMEGCERICLPHSKIMIHDPAFGNRNIGGIKPLQIEKELSDLMDTRKILAEIIAERTGKSPEEILEKTKEDFFLKAEEALEYGIATKIDGFTLEPDEKF